jgi:microsomal dipeptidase-like Zn-dependent dipeptidase
MNFSNAFNAHVEFRDAVLQNQGARIVWSAEDVLRTDGIGFVFGMQHTPTDMTEGRLYALHDAGVRMMAIAYIGTTEYGNGFAVPLGGLTKKGQRLLQMMSDVGMILDLSHANHSTAEDALSFIEKRNLSLKVMASHSGATAIYAHPRNLPDYLLRDIAVRDGYVGVPAITFMLTKERVDNLYIANFVQHISHVVTVCGIRHVGIGSDCLHANQTQEEAERQYRALAKMIDVAQFHAYFPDRPLGAILHGQELFEVFGAYLHGFDLEHREAILGGNFLDFLFRSLPQT